MKWNVSYNTIAKRIDVMIESKDPNKNAVVHIYDDADTAIKVAMIATILGIVEDELSSGEDELGCGTSEVVVEEVLKDDELLLERLPT